MKRKDIRSTNRLADIRLAQRRKKEMVARLLTKQKHDGSNFPQESIRRDGAVEPILSRANPEVLPVSIGLRMRADDALVELHPVRAIGLLAQELLLVAESRKSKFVLLWPGSLRSLGLVHAVATAARWQLGNKQGIRTMLYPAKANFLNALNHAHVDREDLVRLARDLYEDGAGNNRRVTVSFRDKDPFWLSLNNLDSNVAGRIHPSLAELLPHFFASKDFDEWRSCDGDLLRHIKVSLKHNAERRLLSQHTIRKLSDPKNAPDALFAISWKASRADVGASLKALDLAIKPDALILDLTRSMRKGNPSWRSNAITFLDCFRSAFAKDTPPVLFVIDEPHVRGQMLKELNRNAVKKGEASRWLLANSLPIDGVICPVRRDGFTKDKLKEEPPSAKEIHVAITDTEAAEVIALLDRVREGITRIEWIQVFDDAEAYLEKLAALPSSTRVLIRWLSEADVPTAVRENYAWPVFRSRLEQVLYDPTFKKRTLLKHVIEKGSDLWTNYENGTPMARKLADLIEEHTRGEERCCVAFTRPTARRLAERYFETYDGYPEGAGFEILKDCVRFVVSRELEGRSDDDPEETLILAGLDEDSLRLLLIEERFSSPIYVLLTRRNAAYLKATLSAINAMPGFSALSNRVRELLKQLPNFPEVDEHSLFSRSDFVLPTFSFEAGLSSVVPSDEDSEEAGWELLLDSGLRLRRSPQSSTYIYDPALSHAPGRGFKLVDVKSLEVGDRIFVMSVELRELTEVALKDAGIQISSDRHFESALRKYHERIGELVRARQGSSLAEKSRDLWSSMQETIGLDCAMPAERTLRSWLDVERFRGVSFESAKPSAPRQEIHFKALAQVLGLQDYEAVYYWKAVIQPLRGARRADGKRVSDAYAGLLLDPESAVVHKRMSHVIVRELFSRAQEHVHVVEEIRKSQWRSSDA